MPGPVIIGLLGTTKEATQDQWESQELATLSFLSCGTNTKATIFSTFDPDNLSKDRKYILGDNGPARLIITFPQKTSFHIKTHPKAHFLSCLKAIDQSTEHVVVILAAHSDETGQIAVGTETLEKSEVESALKGFKGQVTLISAACFSDQWESIKWEVIAAAGPLESSISFPSVQFRDGQFREAAACHSPQTHGIATPTPFKAANPQNFEGDDISPGLIVAPNHTVPSIPESIAGMNASIRDYPCSKFDFFGTTNTKRTIPFAEICPDFLQHITVHRQPEISPSNSGSDTFLRLGRGLPEPSNTEVLFPRPDAPPASNIDRFLATSKRLVTSAANVSLIGFIKRAAADPQLRAEADDILTFRDKKREQTRAFVTLMNWSPTVNNEAAGLGLSDAAMDFADPDGLKGGMRLDSALGERFGFLNAVAPTQEFGGSRAVRYREPFCWAARHWVYAGSPNINTEQAHYTMRRAGLLPDDNALILVQAQAPFTVSQMQVVY